MNSNHVLGRAEFPLLEPVLWVNGSLAGRGSVLMERVKVVKIRGQLDCTCW